MESGHEMDVERIASERETDLVRMANGLDLNLAQLGMASKIVIEMGCCMSLDDSTLDSNRRQLPWLPSIDVSMGHRMADRTDAASSVVLMTAAAAEVVARPTMMAV